MKKTILQRFKRMGQLRLSLFVVGIVLLSLVFSGCALRGHQTEPAAIPEDPMPRLPADHTMEGMLAMEFPKDPALPIREEALSWIALYDERFGPDSSTKILATEAEIGGYNQNLQLTCPKIYPMEVGSVALWDWELKEIISAYVMPNRDLVDGGGHHVDLTIRNQILANRNLDSIPTAIAPKTAVVTTRCDLKSMPTLLDLYDYGKPGYSLIQEAELIVSTPVLILHESLDGDFVFVQAYHYRGWIPVSAVSYCDEESYSFFTKPDGFIIVTDTVLQVFDTRLDMGSVLPYVHETFDSFTVSLPIRLEDGTLGYEEAVISKTSAHFGYLPYTMENYYRQAFSYLGTEYGWGGHGGKVDCSGFVCSVMRCFGLYLPRNTSEQILYAGLIQNLQLPSAEESARVLHEIRFPATVHRPGHVMLYLGEKDGEHYVIHAPSAGQEVSVMKLSLPSNLLSASLLIPYLP